MKSIILILSILFSLTSCSDDKIEKQEIDITGLWSLIKFEPGFSPTENFSENQIIWSFQQTNILKIQIDNTVSTPPLKTEGEYNFSINGNRVTIDNMKYDFSINENILIISDNPSSDGFKATFSKEIE